MIYRMCAGDMSRFFIIYIIYLLGLAQGKFADKCECLLVLASFLSFMRCIEWFMKTDASRNHGLDTRQCLYIFKSYFTRQVKIQMLTLVTELKTVSEVEI